MSGAALRHFVEEALGRHADDLDDWFPSCFHWRGLVADAAQMTASVAGRPYDADDLEGNEAIRARASLVFRFAHVTTLAMLAAGGAEDSDPGETLEILLDEPDDGEEAYYRGLVNEVMGPLEANLAGDAAELDARGEAAYALINAAWPAIETFAQEDGVLGEETQPLPGDSEDERAAVRRVLEGIAMLAAILAAFRYLSVGRAPTAAE
ncbi:MAG: hypothetical protein QNJ98_06080 [Planctomycetota bacterium]|nr:hypothetical protein [Planctomycetota bacterium]